MTRQLTLDDIADARAYEREREAFREHVIALKKRRRVSVGPFVTFVFENRTTVLFQIEEMARAERILTDEGIQTELDIYNPLIPEPGFLSATMFIELTSKAELETWLPKLVGIERAVELRIGDSVTVRAIPESGHASQLTREEITASVHYVQFALTPEQIAAFADASRVQLAVDHPDYQEVTDLSEETRAEVLLDLRG